MLLISQLSNIILSKSLLTKCKKLHSLCVAERYAGMKIEIAIGLLYWTNTNTRTRTISPDCVRLFVTCFVAEISRAFICS